MKRVLIVDDSPTMRRMVMSSLRSIAEIEFTEAANGLEAIEKLSLGPVTLMVLDLNMPDMTIGAQNITKQITLITRANRDHSVGADSILKALNEVRSITQENTKSLWAITDLLEVKGPKSVSRTTKGRTAKAGS